MKKFKLKKFKSDVILALPLLICVFLLAGCGGSDSDGVLDSLEITLPEGAVATVQVNGTLQLGVDYTPSDTTLKAITWTSSDDTKATVDDTGLVTGVAVGQVTITAKSTKKPAVVATKEITVQAASIAVTGIVFGTTTNPTTEIELDQWGTTQGLTAVIAPFNATNKTVTWESSDPTKVSVTVSPTNGLFATLAGLLPTGSNPVTITVTTDDGGFTASCEVTVNDYVEITGITLSETTLDVTVGASETLTATTNPPNATIQNITWESSNTSRVTVSATGSLVTIDGLVMTLSPVIVTATATKRDGTTVTATCEVSVVSFNGVEAFGWDAEEDLDFGDLPFEGEKTIGGITVYNFSTNSDSTGPIGAANQDTGVMKAVQKGELVGGFVMEKAGYLLKEDTSPCLEIGSNAYNRTNTTNIFDLVDKDGNPAIAGQFDLSRPCSIKVEYTGIASAGSGTVLIAILNNSGSVNTSNSPLKENSGAFQSVVPDGTMKTYVRTFDPRTFDKNGVTFEDVEEYLKEAFFIVRAAVAGTQIVVHSVTIEIAQD